VPRELPYKECKCANSIPVYDGNSVDYIDSEATTQRPGLPVGFSAEICLTTRFVRAGEANRPQHDFLIE